MQWGMAGQNTVSGVRFPEFLHHLTSLCLCSLICKMGRTKIASLSPATGSRGLNEAEEAEPLELLWWLVCVEEHLCSPVPGSTASKG